MVVVNVASFVTGIIIERRWDPSRNNPMAAMFAVYARTAVEVLERDGQTGLAAYLNRVEETSHLHSVLLDESANEVSGRTVPDAASDLVHRVDENSPFDVFFPRDRHHPLAVQAVRGTNGQLYVLVAELPVPDFPRPPPRLGEPGSFRHGLQVTGRTLLPLLLIGAFFCYLLARYLSTPVVQLRNATQALSEGKLGTRVDDKLLERTDEIGYLGRDFNVMASRMELLVGAQRQLLADISHELRSPLARLGVALGLARRHSGSDATKALDRIEREAERMNEMIAQLLTLSRIESGADSLRTVAIDLRALVMDVVEDADFEARSAGRSVQGMELQPCVVYGVHDLLRSAIENLVRNGVRHTPANGTVEVSLCCEAVGAEQEAVISVRDYGSGVPEKALSEIFRPFYRVEDARDRQTGGVGLGLAIVARAVALHGGKLRAFNAPGGGLSVTMRLPLRAASIEMRKAFEALKNNENGARTSVNLVE